jgi:hypothetical protein
MVPRIQRHVKTLRWLCTLGLKGEPRGAVGWFVQPPVWLFDGEEQGLASPAQAYACASVSRGHGLRRGLDSSGADDHGNDGDDAGDDVDSTHR